MTAVSVLSWYWTFNIATLHISRNNTQWQR